MSPCTAISSLLVRYTRYRLARSALFALALCGGVAAAATSATKTEEEPPVVDRWAVENTDYSDKWGVESADMDARWGVETRLFEDSLGERKAEQVPIIHRGITFDTRDIPAVGQTSGAEKARTGKKPAKKGNNQSTNKKPKAAAAKPAKKAKPVDKKSASKSAPKDAGKKSGKKGSYKKYTMDVNGVAREYYVYLPADYQKGKKYPVVIAFHGYQSDANGFRWLIKPDKWANKNQYILVYPNAVNKSWNVGKGTGSANKNTDDVAFSRALYKEVLARHPVDSNRLYVMGFSNGAQMAALWVCQMAGKIAAAAMVAHTMNIPDCKPSHKTPIALLHGMQDKLAPYKGGGKHKVASHMESVEFFKKVNGTTDKKIHLQSSKTYKCESWVHGKKITEVIDCKMYNNGHSWPGGVEFMVDVLGTTNKDFNATEFLFRMFSRYKKLPAPR